MKRRLIKALIVLAIIYFAIAAYGRFHYLLPWHDETRISTVWDGNTEYKVVDGQKWKVEETYTYTIPEDGVPMAPYIPDTQPCMAVMSPWGGVDERYVDEACMDRQKLRSEVTYCAKHPEDCVTTTISLAGTTLHFQLPKEDSAFYDYLNQGK